MFAMSGLAGGGGFVGSNGLVAVGQRPRDSWVERAASMVMVRVRAEDVSWQVVISAGVWSRAELKFRAG